MREARQIEALPGAYKTPALGLLYPCASPVLNLDADLIHYTTRFQKYTTSVGTVLGLPGLVGSEARGAASSSIDSGPGDAGSALSCRA